jgi:hypothetical protein
MSMSIGFISAIPLLEFGTVSVIQDEVGSRLHSSWLWGVIPHFVLSGILMLAAWKTRRLG